MIGVERMWWITFCRGEAIGRMSEGDPSFPTWGRIFFSFFFQSKKLFQNRSVPCKCNNLFFSSGRLCLFFLFLFLFFTSDLAHNLSLSFSPTFSFFLFLECTELPSTPLSSLSQFPPQKPTDSSLQLY